MIPFEEALGPSRSTGTPSVLGLGLRVEGLGFRGSRLRSWGEDVWDFAKVLVFPVVMFREWALEVQVEGRRSLRY